MVAVSVTGFVTGYAFHHHHGARGIIAKPDENWRKTLWKRREDTSK